MEKRNLIRDDSFLPGPKEAHPQEAPLTEKKLKALTDAYNAQLRLVQKQNKVIYRERKKKALNRKKNKMAKASKRRNR